MAEATDRPQGGGGVPSGAATSPTEERISAWPEGAAASGGELGSMPATGTETYRPLSLLALAGFGVAVLYALLVLVGGVVALVNHIPWLMPGWTFIIPIAALVLCGMARTRIRHSEGTLSGLAFSTWGLRLSVILGLTYGCYYGFSSFAVRLQAMDCAEQFFKQIKQDRVERAFLLGMVVNIKDVDDAELRDMLEVRFNAPAGRSMRSGPYTLFRQSDYVRAVQTAGAEAHIEPVGVTEWGYESGGYKVVIKYHIVTPLTEFDMLVATLGQDSKPGEAKGRRWQVDLRGGSTHTLSATQKLTPRGEDVMKSAMAARAFVSAWLEKVNRQQWAEVYLDTQEPAERERLRTAQPVARLLSAAPIAGLAPLGLCDAPCRELLAGVRIVTEGKLIQIDEKKFWTTKSEREAILKRVRQTFQATSGGSPTFTMQLQDTPMPLWRTDSGKRIYLFDTGLIYLGEMMGMPMPKYAVEAKVAVAVDERAADSSSPPWRIQSIEVTSGRTAMMMPNMPPPPPPPPPGGPGMPGGL